jgi:hypothetical protein
MMDKVQKYNSFKAILSPKACRWEELTICRSVWLLCMWQYDISMYETYGQLSQLQFLGSIIKCIISFLSNRKFRVLVQGEMSMPCEIQAGAPQGSVLSPYPVQLVYKWTRGIHQALFADNTCIYTTDCKGYVLKKLQHGLTSMESWCWVLNIKSKPSTSLIAIEQLRLVLCWKGRTSCLWIIKYTS